MAAIHVVHVVGDADQRFAFIGQLAKEPHHAGLGAGIEAAGGLVNVKQARPGQQLRAETDAFDLTAGKVGHQRAAVRAQLHDLDDFLDAVGQLAVAGVRRQAQLGGVIQGAVDRQLGVDDVLLRNIAQRLPEVVENSGKNPRRWRAPVRPWPSDGR